ncbi:tail assembly chaperone [Pseudomonas phage Lana]|uniref:Uncharacterized protein n=1 Tax=Pseudomonas phage Lana TaxID=2530172 RepID=A0A481W811_9CAUD|nr:tail assembly chaperone [Pseudomonas phage Lana]QBJ04562.1 hypothetical protein [Pseudomonas phage Lana]
MLDLAKIAVDPKLSQEGVWAEFWGGRFLLARRGPAYQARLGELYLEKKDLIKSDTKEGTEALMEIYQRSFADTVLLNWEGVSDEGVEIEFSPEAAFKVLSDPRLAELTTFLEQFSLNHSNYREAAEAEVADNVKSTAVS